MAIIAVSLQLHRMHCAKWSLNQRLDQRCWHNARTYIFVYKISRSHSFQWQSHSHMSNVQQYILRTIHSNKQSVEFKIGERRMDKCWNSIGMGFKCWRQREWRMKFYHLHSCVQCFWLFVLFDWHIPNYDDSDNNSSICANDVLPTKTMYMMWVIAIENFLGIFSSISSTFILVFWLSKCM